MQVNQGWPRVFFFIVAAMVLTGTVLALDRGGCWRTTISMMVSPDDTWVALVQEEICSDGYFVTIVVNRVQLARRALVGTVELAPSPEQPITHENENVVFAVGGPNPEQRPLTRWLSPKRLQITVPNLSLTDLKKNSYEGVEIVIKREPDDPDARERWLQERGLKPK